MLAWTRVLRPTPRAACVRSLAHKATSDVSKVVPERTTAAGPGARSSCLPNTVLVGVNYFKDQPPVLALADEEYPSWLWKLLDKSELPDDGPGGKAEKRRLRKENRQRIRDQNFMKTQ